MRKKGAIFDLDGTLINTFDLHVMAWKQLFTRYHVTLTPEELQEQSGRTNLEFIKIILQRRARPELNPKTLSKEKDMIVLEVFQRHPPQFFPKAVDTLRLFKASGVQLAIATSATQVTARKMLGEHVGLFNTIVTADDVRRGKPHPEIFLTAAHNLGLSPEECVVFEDAHSGLQAAKAGGFRCILKIQNPQPFHPEANDTFHDYSEQLLNFLDD